MTIKMPLCRFEWDAENRRLWAPASKFSDQDLSEMVFSGVEIVGQIYIIKFIYMVVKDDPIANKRSWFFVPYQERAPSAKRDIKLYIHQ